MLGFRTTNSFRMSSPLSPSSGKGPSDGGQAAKKGRCSSFGPKACVEVNKTKARGGGIPYVQGLNLRKLHAGFTRSTCIAATTPGAPAMASDCGENGNWTTPILSAEREKAPKKLRGAGARRRWPKANERRTQGFCRGVARASTVAEKRCVRPTS